LNSKRKNAGVLKENNYRLSALLNEKAVGKGVKADGFVTTKAMAFSLSHSNKSDIIIQYFITAGN